MPIDFFDKEVVNARRLFNQVYGRLSVCDLQTRSLAAMTVISMGCMARTINAVDNKDEVRDLIRRFVRTRDIFHTALGNIQALLEDQAHQETTMKNSARASAVI